MNIWHFASCLWWHFECFQLLPTSWLISRTRCPCQKRLECLLCWWFGPGLAISFFQTDWHVFWHWTCLLSYVTLLPFPLSLSGDGCHWMRLLKGNKSSLIRLQPPLHFVSRPQASGSNSANTTTWLTVAGSDSLLVRQNFWEVSELEESQDCRVCRVSSSEFDVCSN